MTNTNPQYFEGILQLRNVRDEAIDFIDKMVSKTPNVHIAKIAKVRNGLDFYLSSNSFLMKIGKSLNKEFGGIYKKSSTLHTRSKQTSKELYRVTVLIDLPHVFKGEFIVTDTDVIKVTSIDKKIHGTRLSSGKKTIIDYDKKLKIVPKMKTIVTKVKPQLEIMHPETYQSVSIIKSSRKDLKHGEKIEAAFTKHGNFIV